MPTPRSKSRLEGLSDKAQSERLRDSFDVLRSEISKVVAGQTQVVELLLTALFSDGHALLIGVPGLAKTLLAATMGRLLDLSYQRIQFTPDLMPADITGTDVIEEDAAAGTRSFRFLRGPVFTQLLLADEINRAPPKTQAALLEAMQERQVTVGGKTLALAPPFWVVATQNPMEQEGTYALPEAQLDRFLFAIRVPYPTEAEEFEVLKSPCAANLAALRPVINATEIVRGQELVRRVPVARTVERFALELVRRSRPEASEATLEARRFLVCGAGPRATLDLLRSARAHALLHGRFYATRGDVTAVATSVLPHRVTTNLNAEAEGIDARDVIDRLIRTVAPQEKPDLV